MTALFHDLSIVVPARNEAANIESLLSELKAEFPGAELIVVDNGSTDETSALACKMGDVTVLYEAKAGKGNAMRTGAAAASKALLMFHDADLEYAPADARALVYAVRKAPGSMAVGVRQTAFGRPAWSSLFAAAAVRRLLQWRWGADRVGEADVLCGTRVLARGDFLQVATQQQGFRIETELTRRTLALGLSMTHHPVTYRPRSRTEGKKIRPSHLWGILLEAML